MIRWWWFSLWVLSDSCSSMDCSLPVSSVYGVLQAQIMEWVAISFSNDDTTAKKIIYIYIYMCVCVCVCIVSIWTAEWLISWLIQKEIAEEEIVCWVLSWAGDYLKNLGMNVKESAEQKQRCWSPKRRNGRFLLGRGERECFGSS